MIVTTKIIADVAPEIKEKLISIKQPGETNKDVLIRLIEKEFNACLKKVKK